MNSNKTGILLQSLRKERHFTQQDLADKLGLTFQAVSKWERGENLPDSYTLIELAKLYNCTVDEILHGELIVVDNYVSYTKRNFLLIISIVLFIVSGIPYLILSDVNKNFAITLTLLIVGAAVGIITYVGLKYGNTFSKKQSTTSLKEDKYGKIVYPICVYIFLMTGLIWGLFYINWTVFILGYIVVQILSRNE